MRQQGYYRFPTIHGSQVVFVVEDDLWTVPATGGCARRLTTNLGWAGLPRFSPDGRRLAFTGVEDGQAEVYCMAADGGPLTRVTWLGTVSVVLGWTPDGKEIVFRSTQGQPFRHLSTPRAVPFEGGAARDLHMGPATEVAFGPRGATILGRWTGDPARWKRYRGGRAGVLWIDRKGSGDFEPFLDLPGNLASPMFVGGRVWFLSDHEGMGNLYSCRLDGTDLRRQTHHHDFYVRYPSTDGKRVVYGAGADLYVIDAKTGKSRKLAIDFASPRTQTGRKFVDAFRYLDDLDLHPKGASLLAVSRGKAFSFSHWEGAVAQSGRRDGVRYRLARWLKDGARFVCLSDEGGEEALEIHVPGTAEPAKRLPPVDFGRAYEIKVSPAADVVAVITSRHELWTVDLKSGKSRRLDRSDFFPIAGYDWSPDGKWLAYSYATGHRCWHLRLVEVATGKVHDLTRPAYLDYAPAFDPDGKYLYFLSYRSFDPVYCPVTFDYNFPLGAKPFVLTLQADAPSPFLPQPRAPGAPGAPGAPTSDAKKDDTAAKDAPVKAAAKGSKASSKPPADKPPAPTKIDLPGIQDRVLSFPVEDGHYLQLRGLPGGKLLFRGRPLEGTLDHDWFQEQPPAKSTVYLYDMVEGKRETIAGGVAAFTVSADHKALAFVTASGVRVIKAGDKADEATARERPGRKSGWIDWSRVRLAVTPASEWAQMFDEAWRLQREFFWTADLSGVDWHGVRAQYRPLVERVATRGEFSDLMWEVQGELGTSHAYEFGGDYRLPPRWPVGHLGADLAWDGPAKGWRIVNVVRGSSWKENETSPLAAPGVGVAEGDLLLAIDGLPLSARTTPGELLVHKAGTEVSLTVRRGDQPKERTVVVKTLRSEDEARYRSWVEGNRARVHEETGGRVGYVHVPDCGPWGYSEFHRSFQREVDRDGLIVDIRFNGGGHVSGLLVEKLARRRLAYCKPRWGKPDAYPENSPAGPMVALTNEAAGSDGDILSHAFKLLGLGPLIGKRTWGGVIGINVVDTFVDHGLTTQPQYSFWFADVGWGVENYGTDPDIEVEVTPRDYAEGRDPQLARAIQEALRQVELKPGLKPDFEPGPNLARPRLPKRR